MVANAYNTVRKRRDALEAILRSAAKTDALTKLPNRYSFEQYILEAGERGYSAAVLLFDVNFLKKVNDTQGHLAGDTLLCSTAECIASCFGEHCFRFGGDEFAAVVRDCTPESIEYMLEKFEVEQRMRDISISTGCAYAADIGTTSYRELLDLADKDMYVRKKAVHSREDWNDMR
jgi:diguanylate cyclase (GGDEF)-like protein